MTTISRNPITGDIENKADYFTTVKSPRKTFNSLYSALIKSLQSALSLSIIEAVEIIQDNRNFITNTIEVDGVTDVKEVVKLIAAKY